MARKSSGRGKTSKTKSASQALGTGARKGFMHNRPNSTLPGNKLPTNKVPTGRVKSTPSLPPSNRY